MRTAKIEITSDHPAFKRVEAIIREVEVMQAAEDFGRARSELKHRVRECYGEEAAESLEFLDDAAHQAYVQAAEIVGEGRKGRRPRADTNRPRLVKPGLDS